MQRCERACAKFQFYPSWGVPGRARACQGQGARGVPGVPGGACQGVPAAARGCQPGGAPGAGGCQGVWHEDLCSKTCDFNLGPAIDVPALL